MDEWQLAAPDPARYRCSPSLKPHPFMGLNKFDAGRMHQMRSGKSYLKVHPSWDSTDPHMCQRCGEVPKTCGHAILSCTAREPAKGCHLQGVSDLSPTTLLWSSVAPSAKKPFFPDGQIMLLDE